MNLVDAQKQVATDWLAVWKQIKDKGATDAPARATTRIANGGYWIHPRQLNW